MAVGLYLTVQADKVQHLTIVEGVVDKVVQAAAEEQEPLQPPLKAHVS